MRKTQIAICATVALGLCLLVPKGASAFPVADGSGKVSAQTIAGKSAATTVRWAGRVGGWRGGRVGFRRGIGWRGAGWGGGWRGAYWRTGWRRGYYGGYGWRRPVGLGLGLGVAATDWGSGYPSYGGNYGGWGYWPFGGFGLGIGTGGSGYGGCGW
jgi:hypothetical protein